MQHIEPMRLLIGIDSSNQRVDDAFHQAISQSDDKGGQLEDNIIWVKNCQQHSGYVEQPSHAQERPHPQRIAQRTADKYGCRKSEKRFAGKNADQLLVDMKVSAQIIQDGSANGKHHCRGHERNTTGNEQPLALTCRQQETSGPDRLLAHELIPPSLSNGCLPVRWSSHGVLL